MERDLQQENQEKRNQNVTETGEKCPKSTLEDNHEYVLAVSPDTKVSTPNFALPHDPDLLLLVTNWDHYPKALLNEIIELSRSWPQGDRS